MNPKEMNYWADMYRNEFGANVIPMDSINKTPLVKWERWRNEPIHQWTHDHWLRRESFSRGMAIICGKVWHNEEKVKRMLYLNGIDCDNQLAIDEICKSYGVQTLDHLADLGFIIEGHPDDVARCHIYAWATKPFKTKTRSISETGRTNIPKIEVKGQGGLMICTPSIHKNGQRYRFISKNGQRYRFISGGLIEQ